MNNSPWVNAINRRMAEEGSSPLRQRMLEGRAQFWVVRRDGKVVASHTVRSLAYALDVTLNGEDMTEEPKDLITVARAATITGYSQSNIHIAAKAGKIKAFGTWRRMVSRAEVEKWAAEKKALGGNHLPRKGTKHGYGKPRHGRPAKPNRAAISASTSGGVRARLARYLQTLHGTPHEMTQEQFIERVISQALDKLKA